MKNLSNIEHELDIVTKQYVDNAAETKVDKVEGKQLSTNDFSNEDKEKLNSLENYILPTASADALGGIKIGNNLNIDENGILTSKEPFMVYEGDLDVIHLINQDLKQNSNLNTALLVLDKLVYWTRDLEDTYVIIKDHDIEYINSNLNSYIQQYILSDSDCSTYTRTYMKTIGIFTTYINVSQSFFPIHYNNSNYKSMYRYTSSDSRGVFSLNLWGNYLKVTFKFNSSGLNAVTYEIIEESYTLPIATTETLGGIKVGENLTIAEDGTLNAQTGAEDVIIPYKTFADYSDEEKTSIANKLLNCINAVKSLTKICYLEDMGVYYPLSGIVNSENNIDFIFIILEGFTQGQITYTVSTTSNTLINVTLNTSNLVDSDMSDTSIKPVQNKVIKKYVDKNVATLVNVGNIDWDEVTPNTKGYIANKPFGRINTFANTTNILFENTTHTGNMKVYDMIFNIDFPSGFAENIENITTATLQYGNKTYDIRTISKATLKRTCTENQTYSKILEYTGEFNTESIVFKLNLKKSVKRTDGTTILKGTLTCNVKDLIASGIISEIPEDGTVNLTFGLKVTTTGTEIKVIDSAYLPIASANTLGAIKVGNNLTIDENGILNGNDVDLTSYAKKNELPTKVSDLTNDSLFITNTVNNLTNYYTKTETYTQEQINDLISAAAGLKLEVVSVLPTTDISTSTIYLKGTETEGTNDYEEWIYVNNNWELIGTTEVDLTPYTTKEYTDNTFAKKSLYSDTTINIGRTSGTTVGQNSTAEGSNTTASGDCSHAEGDSTKASGYGSHAEGGNQTKASGLYSHAEGQTTEATGSNSHAEGSSTKATQSHSHAEGSYTTASGVSSHAEGDSTKASGNNQHVQGKYNIEDTTSAHIVGNGSSSARSNAHTLDWSGNAWFSGDVYTGSTSGTNKDDGSKKLATEEYVDSAISTNAMPASSIVNNFWIGTQTEYDAIATKSSTTLYMIKEG